MSDQSSNSSRQPQIPQDVRVYLENLLQDANVSASDEVREEMLYQLFERMDKYLSAQIINTLPTNTDCETFIRMQQEQRSQEEIQTFLQEKIPNVQEFMSKVFIDFRDSYLVQTTDPKK